MTDPHDGSRIDVHHHFYAPEYLAVMGEMGKRPVVRDWSVSRSLEEMDKKVDGIQLMTRYGATAGR
jgi:hypothetical protein